MRTRPLSIPTILCPRQEVAETERLDSGTLGVFLSETKVVKEQYSNNTVIYAVMLWPRER